jgi:hypothetical protein
VFDLRVDNLLSLYITCLLRLSIVFYKLELIANCWSKLYCNSRTSELLFTKLELELDFNPSSSF